MSAWFQRLIQPATTPSQTGIGRRCRDLAPCFALAASCAPLLTPRPDLWPARDPHSQTEKDCAWKASLPILHRALPLLLLLHFFCIWKNPGKMTFCVSHRFGDWTRIVNWNVLNNQKLHDFFLISTCVNFLRSVTVVAASIPPLMHTVCFNLLFGLLADFENTCHVSKSVMWCFPPWVGTFFSNHFRQFVRFPEFAKNKKNIIFW